jgi:hypothetical protein
MLETFLLETKIYRIMTDKEVLQKAIEIAIENGWMDGYTDWNIFSVMDSPFPLGGHYINFHKASAFEYGMSVNDIIFSHNFAKAFWIPKDISAFKVECKKDGYFNRQEIWRKKDIPEKQYCPKCRLKLSVELEYQDEYDWLSHLQQMVLEENPIDYLRKFIES